MNTPQKILPILRFPKFRNGANWNMDKFCDLFHILSNNTLSRSELSNGKGDVYNIHYGDVLIKFNEYLDVKKEKLPYIKDKTKAERYKIAYLKDGDVVMADTAEDETAGKCTEVINVGDTIVVAGLHTIPCRPRKMFARAYLGYYMNSKVFHDRLLPIMQGAKVTSIPKSSLQNIPLVYPQDLEEQQKIAECLSSIDEEISAVKEKINQLKEHKKGLMQKLFPIAGKFVPEVRFPEFRKDGAWKEESLGCCYKLKGGYAFKSSMFQKNGIPIIRISNIPMDSLFIDLSDCVYYEKIPNDKAFIVNNGDLLLAMSGATTGKTAIYKQNKPAYLNQRVGVFKSIKSTNCYLFLCQWVKTYSYDKQLSSLLTAGAQPNISSNDIETLLFQYPKHLGEQQKIAECLSSIDEQISLYEKKVTLLELHKKGLMQRLFPKL